MEDSKNINISEYKYKYELHLHTCEGSKCSQVPGAEMAKAAKDAGYTGIFVTNHGIGGNTAIDPQLPWKEWVRQFAVGYENAKAWGDENGLAVFFGYESGFNGTEFLIYGITPEWMMEHEKLRTTTIEDQLKTIHQGGGMVIQAHPFREEWYIPQVRLFPDFVDGVEGVNATHSSHLSQSHNDPRFDLRAIKYAGEHGFPMTAGSDVHSTRMLGGGILTREKILEGPDLLKLLKSDEMYLLTDGDRIYDRYGVLLEGDSIAE